MQKRVLITVAASVLLVSSNVFAEAGDWLVRARAVNIDTKNSSSPLPGVAVSNELIPEADISYFLTENISAELVLTSPHKHDVTLNGTFLGTLKDLPPTLLAQYHFKSGNSFRPYVGAGLNYTIFSNVKIPGFVVSRSSTGGALQIGFDIPINKNLSFNVDIKKVYMKTDVKTAAGAYVTTLKIDPVLFGIGLGWKF
ncbi:MAG TPA: OmpW family outer membrane protein [Gallionella sp.]|nr:OmpW family outer membrane protein [Gallionella sp.]